MPVVSDKYRGTQAYDDVRARLIQAARSKEKTVRYRPEVTRLIGIEDDEQGEFIRRELGQVCGEISEDEYIAGRPLLSAVAINQDGEPGVGFFNLAHQLGIPFTDETTFWLNELNRVVEYWTTH